MTQRRPNNRRRTNEAQRSARTPGRPSHVQLYTQRAERAARTPEPRRASERIARTHAKRPSARNAAARPRARQQVPRRAQAHQRRPFTFLIVAALGCVALLFFWLKSCVFVAPSATPKTEAAAPLQAKWAGVNDTYTMFDSDYDYSKLSTEGTYFSFNFNGQNVPVGIDVSEHNSTIDWSKVKASGIDFAYIRLGYRGTTIPNIAQDKLYAQNMSGAKDAGLKLGVYFFSQATTVDEAKEEARYVLDTLGDASLDYPVAFDFEPQQDGTDRISNLSQEEKTEIAKAFCETINEGGYNAIVYGNQHDLQLYNLTELASWGFWYAEYDSKPTYTIKYGIWQYSSTGTVPGISGNVDINLDMIDVLRSEADV